MIWVRCFDPVTQVRMSVCILYSSLNERFTSRFVSRMLLMWYLCETEREPAPFARAKRNAAELHGPYNESISRALESFRPAGNIPSSTSWPVVCTRTLCVCAFSAKFSSCYLNRTRSALSLDLHSRNNSNNEISYTHEAQLYRKNFNDCD